VLLWELLKPVGGDLVAAFDISSADVPARMSGGDGAGRPCERVSEGERRMPDRLREVLAPPPAWRSSVVLVALGSPSAAR
jgi:hypothetical protein